MKTSKEPSDPLYIAAIERAMTVLRVLGEAGAPQGVSDVARAAGLTQSTTWRICYTLQKLGYVKSNAAGHMSPGLPLLALGHAALAGENVQVIAQPLLEDLANRHQGVTALAARDGDDMLLVSRFEARDAMLSMNLRTGSRVPILTSAMGWAFLASLPQQEQQRTIAALRKRHPKVPGKVTDMMQEQLRLYPEQGFVVNTGVFHPNVGFAGVPMVHPGSGETFTLNCGGVLTSLPPRKLFSDVGPALRRAADMVRSALGGYEATPA
jgi:DNA-binding IclR family transcriptional regulator